MIDPCYDRFVRHPFRIERRSGGWVIRGSDFDDNIPDYLRLSEYYGRGYTELEKDPRAKCAEQYKTWTAEEVEFLLNYYIEEKTMTIPEIGFMLDRGEEAVQSKIRRLRGRISCVCAETG